MKSRARFPARHLNEKAVFFGLGFEDATWLGFIFAGTWLVTLILPTTRYRALSLIVTVVSGLALIPIRQAYRRHIIRDALASILFPKVMKHDE